MGSSCSARSSATPYADANTFDISPLIPSENSTIIRMADLFGSDVEGGGDELDDACSEYVEYQSYVSELSHKGTLTGNFDGDIVDLVRMMDTAPFKKWSDQISNSGFSTASGHSDIGGAEPDSETDSNSSYSEFDEQRTKASDTPSGFTTTSPRRVDGNLEDFDLLFGKQPSEILADYRRSVSPRKLAMAQNSSPPPMVLIVSGWEGSYRDINGTYKLQENSIQGYPTWRRDLKRERDLGRPNAWRLFWNDHWVLSDDHLSRRIVGERIVDDDNIYRAYVSHEVSDPSKVRRRWRVWNGSDYVPSTKLRVTAAPQNLRNSR